MAVQPAGHLKHLHNVETRFYCRHALLSLDFQCRVDISESNKMTWEYKELMVATSKQAVQETQAIGLVAAHQGLYMMHTLMQLLLDKATPQN